MSVNLNIHQQLLLKRMSDKHLHFTCLLTCHTLHCKTWQRLPSDVSKSRLCYRSYRRWLLPVILRAIVNHSRIKALGILTTSCENSMSQLHDTQNSDTAIISYLTHYCPSVLLKGRYKKLDVKKTPFNIQMKNVLFKSPEVLNNKVCAVLYLYQQWFSLRPCLLSLHKYTEISTV